MTRHAHAGRHGRGVKPLAIYLAEQQSRFAMPVFAGARFDSRLQEE